MTLAELDMDDAQRLWELYVADCYNKNLPARPDEFSLWLEEHYA